MTCYFCKKNIDEIDFKNVALLRQFLSSLGKIKPKRKTKVCGWHQRKLKKAVERARYFGLLPCGQIF